MTHTATSHQGAVFCFTFMPPIFIPAVKSCSTVSVNNSVLFLLMNLVSQEAETGFLLLWMSSNSQTADGSGLCDCPAGGGQQPGAGGSVQRASQHGPGAAAGRRGAAGSAPEHHRP